MLIMRRESFTTFFYLEISSHSMQYEDIEDVDCSLIKEKKKKKKKKKDHSYFLSIIRI